jgi:hypothetical protein
MGTLGSELIQVVACFISASEIAIMGRWLEISAHIDTVL